MDDVEPTLPSQPEASSTSTRPSRPSLLTRKRTYDQSVCDGEPLTATSSDPALFSGDEQESIGAEDYAIKRKKKMYTGSWWNHRFKAGKEDRKKEFKRNYDSGIFMGSDGEPPSSDSITSLEEELMRDQATVSHAQEATGPTSMLGQQVEEDTSYTPLAKGRLHQEIQEDLDATPQKRILVRRNEELDASSYPSSAESNQRLAVVRIIRRCLDEGEETVDLSGHSLSALPPEIRDLAFLMKQSSFVSGMLDSGTSLETHLRLFLGNNFLRRLPPPVLDLTNLRELSLRRNKLTKLPAGIRNLINLEKLNVSGNKLTYLPFEVIELVAHQRLHELTTEPNLWEVFDKTSDDYTVWDRREKGAAGRVNGPGLSRAFQPVACPASSNTKLVPPLTEMILRQLARLRPLEDMRQYMPPCTSPEVLDALRRLDETLQDGGHACNSCHRPVVDAGTQWMEWWRVHHVYVPVKRMHCGIDCTGKATNWCDIPRHGRSTCHAWIPREHR